MKACEITMELPAATDRVFRALASDEIVRWWVRPGVFDTREWSGDVRPGGRWRASGMGGGGAYALEGEFVAVDRPHGLVHTWRASGAAQAHTTVSYVLEPTRAGTRLTMRHDGFSTDEACDRVRAGWETSLAKLEHDLSAEPPAGG